MNNRYWKLIKNKFNLGLFMWICAAFGWWGIIYPEFALTSETCRLVDESGRYVEADAGYDRIDLYGDILQAGSDHIRPRSKLLSAVMSLSEKPERQEEQVQQE